MPIKLRAIEQVDKLSDDLSGLQGSQATLRDIVKEALLNVLKDQEASAAAKASAGRTLLQYFDNENNNLAKRRGADMTAAELDSAIAEWHK